MIYNRATMTFDSFVYDLGLRPNKLYRAKVSWFEGNPLHKTFIFTDSDITEATTYRGSPSDVMQLSEVYEVKALKQIAVVRW